MPPNGRPKTKVKLQLGMSERDLEVLDSIMEVCPEYRNYTAVFMGILYDFAREKGVA